MSNFDSLAVAVGGTLIAGFIMSRFSLVKKSDDDFEQRNKQIEDINSLDGQSAFLNQKVAGQVPQFNVSEIKKTQQVRQNSVVGKSI